MPYCPVHPEQKLRVEHHAEDITGFCSQCLKNWPMCKSNLYMRLCIYTRDHKGHHKDDYGNHWTDLVAQATRTVPSPDS